MKRGKILKSTQENKGQKVLLRQKEMTADDTESETERMAI
jgi:hypothetical protein